ncbi:MAG: hypothetical protein NVSMB5_19180 [Candidatus Velthaea sp.]
MTKRMLTTLALSAGLAVSSVAPALANGAASTRNIIIGGAAATLLIINHNKKVHERYAEDSRRQAQTQASADNARAAYYSERRAYQNEAALVGQYKREVALQHREIISLRHEVAMERSRVNRNRSLGYVQPARASVGPRRVANVSYGWGHL